LQKNSFADGRVLFVVNPGDDWPTIGYFSAMAAPLVSMNLQ